MHDNLIEHPNCGTPDCCMECDTAVSEDDNVLIINKVNYYTTIENLKVNNNGITS
jgi:hypothetical protein